MDSLYYFDQNANDDCSCKQNDNKIIFTIKGIVENENEIDKIYNIKTSDNKNAKCNLTKDQGTKDAIMICEIENPSEEFSLSEDTSSLDNSNDFISVKSSSNIMCSLSDKDNDDNKGVTADSGKTSSGGISTGVIIAIVIVLIVVILAVIMVVLYFIRKKDGKTLPTNSEYTNDIGSHNYSPSTNTASNEGIQG